MYIYFLYFLVGTVIEVSRDVGGMVKPKFADFHHVKTDSGMASCLLLRVSEDLFTI